MNNKSIVQKTSVFLTICLNIVIIACVVGTAASNEREIKQKYKIINTKSGPVRGERLITKFDKKSYYSFKGIPYAEPPINDLRFLPPKPIKKPWKTPRNCFDFGNVCLQFNPLNKTEIIGDENCLFLNIYTPNPNSDDKKTVMVYIHGGGWFFGSGNDDLQGPDLLINKDVVFVTINYRIGVLGFMSLGTPHYSGNQGLKDQQLALKWINQNIGRFGGDKNRITIFGQSAGSTSCQFHIMAPGSRGLFQYAIQMSYTFDIWSVFEKGEHEEDMYWLARKENRTANNYGELIKFLKTTDGSVFTKNFPIKQFYANRTPIEISSKWLPVLENSKAIQPFLQSTPTHLMLEGEFESNISVMMGFTSQEALFYSAPDLADPRKLNAFNENFAIELPSIHFNRNYTSPAYKRVAKQIRDKYFPMASSINGNWDNRQQFAKLMSNIYENYQIDRRVKLLAEKSFGNIYYYHFDLITQLNYYKHKLGALGEYGAVHADDLCYVFLCNVAPEMYQNITRNSNVYGYIETMTSLYTNFAKYGDPMVEFNGFNVNNLVWLPVRQGQVQYLNIGMNGLSVGYNPMKNEMEFWHQIIENNPELMNYNVNQHVDRILKKYNL